MMLINKFNEIDTNSPENFLDSVYAFCVKYKDEMIVDEFFDSYMYNDITPTLEMTKKYPFLYSHFTIKSCLTSHPNWMDVYAAINLKEVFAVVYIYNSINNVNAGENKLFRVLGWCVNKSDALIRVKKLRNIANKYIPKHIIEYLDDKEGELFRSARYHFLSDEKTEDLLYELSSCLNGIDVKKSLSFYGECTFDAPLVFKILRLPLIDDIPPPLRLDDQNANEMVCDKILSVPSNRTLNCIYESYDFGDIDYLIPLVVFHDEQNGNEWIKEYKHKHKHDIVKMYNILEIDKILEF